jgi:magnesium transporter
MTTADDSVVILARHPDGRVDEGTVARIDEIDRLIAEPGMLVWVCVSNPTDELISELQREFGLHALAVEDLRKRNQRPKLDTYESQHVLVAYEVVHEEAPRLSELHLFFSERWMLSVQFGPMPMVDAALRHFADGDKSLADSVDALVYLVLDAAPTAAGSPSSSS